MLNIPLQSRNKDRGGIEKGGSFVESIQNRCYKDRGKQENATTLILHGFYDFTNIYIVVNLR